MLRSLRVTLLLCALLGLAACGLRPTPTAPASANMPNPASVYCEQHGGRLDLRQGPGGVVGICVFADGSECEEWAYMRGECQPGGAPATSTAPAPTVPAPTLPPATLPAPTLPAPTVAPPDVAPGLHVAYAGGGQVRMWHEGQDPRALADAANVEAVRLSDDGQWVAYLSRGQGGAELWAVSAQGGDARVLVSAQALQALQAADQGLAFDFAPASHSVYFSTAQDDLHRVEAEGGAPTRLLDAGEGGWFTISPDGQWLTLYHPDELVLARADGSQARVIWNFPEGFRYTGMGPEIVWAADSAGFSLVSPLGAPDAADNMALWAVPVAGEPQRLATYTGPYGAHLAPDGHSLIYLFYQHEPVDVHLVTPDGRDTLVEAFPQVDFVGWAPDARHFLLDLSPDGRLCQPYLSAPGEVPQPLTSLDDALPVAWVSATRVLYSSHGSALYVQALGQPPALVDGEASAWFDWVTVEP